MPNLLETEREWIFTFGSNHLYPERYVVITGTYATAREKIVARFGQKWAFQYGSKKAAGVDKYNLSELEL